MRRAIFGVVATMVAATAPLSAEVPVTLRGSPESMARQNGVAHDHQLVFVRTPAELRSLSDEGTLVRLTGNDDYEVAKFVTYPYARPEMKTFVERLAAQYHAATGEKLVVTSLTRPSTRQPGNSHALSVHPTGIAVDLRVSQRAASRQWLESTLLSLEEQGLLDITRERYPPHYHVALFPSAYMAHVDRLLADEVQRRAALAKLEALNVPAAAAFVASSDPVAAHAPETRSASTFWAAVVVLPAVWLVSGLRRRRRGD